MSKKRPKAANRATIADQLRQAIKDSGDSVNAIARAADIAQPVLHRFCSGERDLTLTTADKLLSHFGFELKKRG